MHPLSIITLSQDLQYGTGWMNTLRKGKRASPWVFYFLKKIASTQYNYSLSRSAIWHRVNTLRKGKKEHPLDFWLKMPLMNIVVHWPKYVAGLFFARMSKGLFIKVWEIQFHSDPLLVSQRDSQEHSAMVSFWPCQRNLIKTLQIEAITPLITKIT